MPEDSRANATGVADRNFYATTSKLSMLPYSSSWPCERDG